MEEADSILLLSLQQAGCNLPDDALTVTDLGAGHIVTICQKCVRLINGKIEGIPGGTFGLPQEMSGRFRVCADLAAAIQQLGFKGELNFHQFLYPSEADTRRLLRFLVDKLSSTPSKASKSAMWRGQPNATPATGTGHSLQQAMQGWFKQAEAARRKQSWGLVRTSFLGSRTEHQEKQADGQAKQKPVSMPFRTRALQMGNDRGGLVSDRGPALLSWQVQQASSALEFSSLRAARADKGKDQERSLEQHGVFEDVLKLLEGQKEKVTKLEIADSEVKLNHEAELEALKERLASSAAAAEDVLSRLRKSEEEVAQLVAEGIGLEKDKAQLEEDYLLLKKTTGLILKTDLSLGDLETELKERVKEGEEHMAGLQAEWDSHSAPLLARRAELAAHGNDLRSATSAKLKRARELLAKTETAEQDLQEKEEERARLVGVVGDLERAPKDTNRGFFVRRITDITKQIRKQDVDIAKIISDTRELQRQSNATQEKLSRTYVLADELIFREAKKDPVCKTAYKLLTTMHQRFAALIEKVSETDKVGREIQDLKLKLESRGKRPMDVERVQVDLDAIEAENRELEAKLQALKGRTQA